MSKKYLSLEEAAAVLRMGTDELIRLRERGGIRGFADRGTWKFREEDVQEVQRSRQADSDPDVPLYRDDSDESDSAIIVSDDVGEQPTIISKSGDPLSSSDSEVKLVGSIAGEASSEELAVPPIKVESDSGIPRLSPGSDSDVQAVAPDAGSDSDVLMVGEGLDGDAGPIVFDADGEVGLPPGDSELTPPPLVVDESSGQGLNNLDSDSDIQLVAPPGLNSDSDVALVSESSAEIKITSLDDALGSDSDVRLVMDTPTKKGSDSDVKLVKPGKSQADSDSDVALLRDDDESIALDFTPDDGEGASVLSDESGIALVGDDSAMLLSSESGISLERPGSHIGVTDDDDEGITLDISGDSGISLESAADSGISLESVADSGISLEDSDDFGGTVPMMKALESDDEATAFEIPSLKSDDSEFELAATGGSDSETAVFDLADAEEALDDAVFDLDDEEAVDDDFAGMGASEDELEMGDDVLGEDDELDDLDVFDADEDVFDEGMSPAGQKFAAPIGAVAVEQDWGAGTFAGLLVATVMMVAVGLVMFDLVHNIWSYQQPTAASSMFLDSLGGLYGKK